MTTSTKPSQHLKPFLKREGRDAATYEAALSWTLADWEVHCPNIRAAGAEWKRQIDGENRLFDTSGVREGETAEVPV